MMSKPTEKMVSISQIDLENLTKALEEFTKTSQSWEQAYSLLQKRISELNHELELKNHELAMTSEYLGNLLESISDGVIAVDLEDKINRFNRSASLISGYKSSEVLGKKFSEVFNRPFSIEENNENTYQLCSKTGRLIPITERNSFITDSHGNVIGKVKVFQDLSEILELRAHIQHKERLALIGEMSATIAHEIRNPLGGIRGFASFLAQDLPEDDPRQRFVKKIMQGIQTLEHTINDLLEYARPIELKQEVRPLCELIRSSLEFLSYDKKNISILVECPPEIKTNFDFIRMKQVITNIVVNAVQSISTQGIIKIKGEVENKFVRIEIKDNGCGIKPEILPKIFSPFFSTKERGTGLGLALCAKIVDAHGGQIKAESAVGEGTTITIWLPL
ncbi:MAG: two-component system sensor histidine kinase NtrB [Candidatus Hydrogenedens sp.]